jgi:hypothetical protein
MPILKNVFKKQKPIHIRQFSAEEKDKYFNRVLDSDNEYFSQSLHYDYPEMAKIGEDIKILF